MELRKIYCIDPEAIWAGQKDIIQTMYIKKDKSKTYVVCENEDGTGQRLVIEKSKMKYNRAHFVLSYSLAKLTIECLVEQLNNAAESLNNFIIETTKQEE